MYCLKCGKEIANGSRFCKYCGAKQPEMNSAAAKPKTVPEPEAKTVPVPEAKTAPVPEAKTVPEPEAKAAPEPKAKAAPVPEVKTVPEPKAKAAPVPEVKPLAEEKAKPAEAKDIKKVKESGTAEKKAKNNLPVLIAVIAIIALLVAGALVAYFAFSDRVGDTLARITGRSVEDESEDEEDKDAEVDSFEKGESGVLPDTESEDMAEDDFSTWEADVAAAFGDEENIINTDTWQGAYISAIDQIVEQDKDRFSVIDIDDDGIPEIIASGSEPAGSKVIMTWKSGLGVDSVTSRGEVVTYSKEAKAFCDSYVDPEGAHDVVYSIGSGGFEKIFDGSYKQDPNQGFNEAGDPNILYSLSGSETDCQSYYDELSNIFLSKNAGNIDDNSSIDRDSLIAALKEDSLSMSTEEQQQKNGVRWKFDFKEELQFFTAPYNGSYSFTLYGANGGADNIRDYDEEAAVLSGKMSLKAGESVVIITGGAGGICKDYYDMVNGIGYPVPGGYNGGGMSFSSGGGGGCTDIYYKGIRVAAAAGSGGGNYDVVGTMGRMSGAGKKITSNKLGQGSDTLDAGGGGAGWVGGIQGKKNQCGYGGVNGWDGAYFEKISESEGNAYTESGSRDGSAIVEFAGN